MVIWVCEASEVNNLTELAVGPNSFRRQLCLFRVGPVGVRQKFVNILMIRRNTPEKYYWEENANSENITNKKKYSENLKKIPVRPEKLQFSEKIRR